AVAEVLAARDGPQGQLVLVGDAHDRLDLLDGRWRHRAACAPQRLRPRRVDIRVSVAILVGRHHPAGADDALQRLDRGIEALRRQPGRQCELHIGSLSPLAEGGPGSPSRPWLAQEARAFQTERAAVTRTAAQFPAGSEALL